VGDSTRTGVVEREILRIRQRVYYDLGESGAVSRRQQRIGFDPTLRLEQASFGLISSD
jgi:hypothetical protein